MMDSSHAWQIEFEQIDVHWSDSAAVEEGSQNFAQKVNSYTTELLCLIVDGVVSVFAA